MNARRKRELIIFVFVQVMALALASMAKAAPEGDPPKKELIVAIIDTGLDRDLELFRNNLWRNPGESGRDSAGRDKATNGLDDDGNGYVDDVSGWNFLKNNPDLTDRHGHGTHIAGLILAGAGVATPLPPSIRLMVLSYYAVGASDAATLRACEDALRYAVRMGADVINFSGGGRRPSATERKILAEAQAREILLVAAAGNEGLDTDTWPFYPASYDLTNILAVTGADVDHRVLASSNYGAGRIQTSAPGEAILSLLPGGKLGGMTGTSQATALVTHEVLRARLARPDLRAPANLIRQVRLAGQFEEHLIGRTRESTRLNPRSLRTQRDAGLDAADRPLTWAAVQRAGLVKLDSTPDIP